MSETKELFKKQNVSSFTEEQKNFIFFKGKESIVLSSVAGSGKTFSCIQRMKYLIEEKKVKPERIIFFSYTNAAVDELKQRVGNDKVQITTIHSFCLSFLGKIGKFKKPTTFYEFIEWFKEKHKPAFTASKLDRDRYYERITSMYEEADVLSANISAFKLQKAEGLKCRLPDYINEYSNFLKEKRAMDFSDMLIDTRQILKDDKYLKMFKGKFDYVFVDEVQDTSVIQSEILLSLNAKCYYFIGDKNQCAIEGTNVNCINENKKIEDIKIGDKVLTSKGQNNLTYNLVTNVFRNKISDELIKIKTKKGHELITTKNHTHFASFLSNEKELFFTYLMYKEGLGFRIGITKSYHYDYSYRHENRFGFMNRLNGENASKIWIIEVSDSMVESRYWEVFYSITYQIPTIVFKSRSETQNQDFIERVFKNIDTEKGAYKLLEHKNYFFDIPHHFPKTREIKNGKNVNIQLCADGRGKKSIHKLEIHFQGSELKEKLMKNGMVVQNGKTDNGYRIRKQSSNYKDLENIFNVFKKNVNNCKLHETTMLKRGNNLNLTKASYLLKGMTMYVLSENNTIEFDIIESVEKIKYDGYVYDIEVDNTHNFVANNIFTHNSIFGYSGANCDGVENKLKERRETIEMNLSTNFRSGKLIVENSNNFSNLKAIPSKDYDGIVEKGIILFDEAKNKILDNPDSEIVFLVRTNSVIRTIEKRLLLAKVPFRYTSYIKKTEIDDYKKGKANDRTMDKLKSVAPIFDNNIDNVINFIEENRDLKKMAITIHRSKGREFETCIVVNNFSPEIMEINKLTESLTKDQLKYYTFDQFDEENVEDRNVHYVAVSRAKKNLYFMLINVD